MKDCRTKVQAFGYGIEKPTLKTTLTDFKTQPNKSKKHFRLPVLHPGKVCEELSTRAGGTGVRQYSP